MYLTHDRITWRSLFTTIWYVPEQQQQSVLYFSPQQQSHCYSFRQSLIKCDGKYFLPIIYSLLSLPQILFLEKLEQLKFLENDTIIMTYRLLMSEYVVVGRLLPLITSKGDLVSFSEPDFQKSIWGIPAMLGNWSDLLCYMHIRPSKQILFPAFQRIPYFHHSWRGG